MNRTDFELIKFLVITPTIAEEFGAKETYDTNAFIKKFEEYKKQYKKQYNFIVSRV